MPNDKRSEKIGALWTKTGSKGKYLTGEINGLKVVVFPNSYKQEDKQPDFVIYESRPMGER